MLPAFIIALTLYILGAHARPVAAPVLIDFQFPPSIGNLRVDTQNVTNHEKIMIAKNHTKHHGAKHNATHHGIVMIHLNNTIHIDPSVNGTRYEIVVIHKHDSENQTAHYVQAKGNCSQHTFFDHCTRRIQQNVTRHDIMLSVANSTVTNLAKHPDSWKDLIGLFNGTQNCSNPADQVRRILPNMAIFNATNHQLVTVVIGPDYQNQNLTLPAYLAHEMKKHGVELGNAVYVAASLPDFAPSRSSVPMALTTGASIALINSTLHPRSNRTLQVRTNTTLQVYSNVILEARTNSTLQVRSNVTLEARTNGTPEERSNGTLPVRCNACNATIQVRTAASTPTAMPWYHKIASDAQNQFRHGHSGNVRPFPNTTIQDSS